MPVHYDREHFIPIRVSDLVEFLVTGAGAKQNNIAPLAPNEASLFREFAKRLELHFHSELLPKLQQIKDAYAPFDPDADTQIIKVHDNESRAQDLDKLFDRTRQLLAKANYREIPRLEVMQLLEGQSHWGLQLDVAWDVFERIEVFYRGDRVKIASYRPWWKLFLKEEVVVPEFQRLVLLIKLKPHRRLGKGTDTDSVLLKMFKSLPKPDIDMVLPGTKIKLTKWDMGMIFSPLISGFAILAYKILADVIGFQDIFALGVGVALSWSLAAAFAGWGYKSWISYSNRKTQYSLKLTQSLYFQNIDNNAGVFFRLLDEAEEQEIREALLAYYHLWKNPLVGLDAEALDDLVEKDLENRLGIKVDFEIHDALEKLVRLNLVRQENGRLYAIPLSEAVDRLRKMPLVVGESPEQRMNLQRIE